MDPSVKDLNIEGWWNQIGIVYSGKPIKFTIKGPELYNFLKYFQSLFQNGAMGPFKAIITYKYKRFNIEHIEFEEELNIKTKPEIFFLEKLIELE